VKLDVDIPIKRPIHFQHFDYDVLTFTRESRVWVEEGIMKPPKIFHDTTIALEHSHKYVCLPHDFVPERSGGMSDTNGKALALIFAYRGDINHRKRASADSKLLGDAQLLSNRLPNATPQNTLAVVTRG
jgi:hypothetical protein